jgi:hypothetical protein
MLTSSYVLIAEKRIILINYLLLIVWQVVEGDSTQRTKDFFGEISWM